MFQSVYDFLEGIGYTHPIHPPITHIPVGLTIGALVFTLIAVIFGREKLRLSGWHAAVLALVGVLPTALLGYMDWQHRMGGAWMPEIGWKIGLAAALFVLLFVALFVSRKGRLGFVLSIVLYVICFGLVMTLGYLGGKLVYG
ncbi:MAG: hypothetical protein NTU62_01600 [Spirochaetes bacterium]|jgi:uncharacterized membrane protein|nr:hypothetical protein [Spirochaetota bacterium]